MATVCALTLAACSTASPDAPPPDAAVSNQALEFDSASMQYATSGTAQFPNGVAAQTIALWMRYQQATSDQVLVTLRRDTSTGVVLGLRNGTIEAWRVYADSEADAFLLQTSGLPSAGAWHYVAYVFDPGDARSGTATIYVDGVAGASSVIAPNYLTPLEAWYGSLDGTQEFFDGDLDEIRIWTVARTSDEIVADMTSHPAPGTRGLVAYFTCDARDGSAVADESGLGNDMTLGGGTPSRMPTLVPSTAP